MDPALASAFALALENCVNAALTYDAGTRHKLQQLDTCVFHFDLSSPTLSLYMEVSKPGHTDENRFLFAVYSEKNIDCKVSGGLSNFLFLFANSQLSGRGNISSLAESGIRVQGNTAKLAILQDLLQELDIDWEQALIDFNSPLGEGAKVVSHQFAEAIKHFLNWQKENAASMENNLVRFLLDEIKVLPSKVEFKEFSTQVAALRAASERLHARVIRQQQQKQEQTQDRNKK